GYKTLFDALPTSDTKDKPTWIAMPEPKKFHVTHGSSPLAKPEIGTVDLIEEPLDPGFIQNLINVSAKDASTVHWIAVKNLTSMAKRLTIPEGVRVLQPPFLMLDTEAEQSLRKQEVYSADEATLITKLDWYNPTVMDDAPVHGEEKSVWSGKLACTEQSSTYTDQFTDLPSVILLDHRQLLAFVHDPDHAAHGALNADAHIIIDDASMLEDTANKAYGYYCGLNHLRAAAEGNDGLTKFTDLLAIWIEKTRNEQDVRFLAPSDLNTPETISLRDKISLIKEDATLLPQTIKLLEAVDHCLENAAAKRITWIEIRQDGSQFLQSVPESVAELMKEDIFDKYPVSMLIPPRSGNGLQEVLHRGTTSAINSDIPRVQDGLTMNFLEGMKGSAVLTDPPDGKTIVLAASRRVIEQYFVEYTVDLEARGTTLICQNFSGGLNRMQAEFLAASGSVVWVLTPWMFEGVELPPGSVDQLIIDALPFDNPSQPVFSIRAEHFENAFLGYSMPRLVQRLFRVLRTFRRIATGSAEVTAIDNRITEKRYGKTLKKYMELCAEKLSEKKTAKAPNSDFPENWQMNLF
ncbi:MAG: helicase C-terminal domain-containing protein, partial [Candidatus Peribacteraceae bacterium]|nr:helicase C-terminal domain-containing protein [Candidatus Peribacteraceae bacterium]